MKKKTATKKRTTRHQVAPVVRPAVTYPRVDRDCVANAKAAIIKQLDDFVEEVAHRCNGYQSAVRFRDFVEIEFKRHVGLPISKSLIGK